MKTPRILLGITVALLPLGGQEAQSQTLDQNNLVVMISVVKSDGSRDQGAGILIKQRPQVSYVVTADHVVDGDNAAPRKIEVQLYDTRSRDGAFPALRTFTSRQLGHSGVAIIEVHDRVDGPNVIRVPRVLTPALAASLYRGETKDLRGQRAIVVGNGTSGIVRGWMTTASQKVVTARDDKLEIEADVFLPGTSGGAIFEERSGAIIGLATDSGLRRCIGLPIRVVMDAIKPVLPDLDLTFSTQSEQLAVTDKLIQHGYQINAAGLAQALATDDEQALAWFSALSLPSQVIEAALRTRTRRGQDEVPAAQLYFEALREQGAATWLAATLARGPKVLDPNTRVRANVNDESLINLAARASSEVAVIELLKAGANPNGYQDLKGWRIDDPRFLVPFRPILNDTLLDRNAQRRLIDALLAHGAVVPKQITPSYSLNSGTLYGPITHAFKYLQEQMQRSFGVTLPTTPDLCDTGKNAFPETVCATAQRLYGVDWRPVVKAIPRLFGLSQPATDDGPDAPAFIVRYFLGADRYAGYFMVELLTLDSGYAILQVDHDLQQMVLLRYTSDGYSGSPGCIGKDMVEYCWRPISISFDRTTGNYRTQYDKSLRVSNCQAAEQSSRARVAAVTPAATPPDPQVTACVNQILATPSQQLIEQAHRFSLFDVLTLRPRDCVLSRMQSDLKVAPKVVEAPDYIRRQATRCCTPDPPGRKRRY